VSWLLSGSLPDYSTPRVRSSLISGLGHAELAEDLGVVLAELWGDGAHPHILADLDRAADVRDFALVSES
jgi:hypothetical protein